MHIGDDGIELIASFEKCRLKAYDDGYGVWTIGYGHTKGVRPGMVISQEEAEELFREDLEEFEGYVLQTITETPTQNEFDAMVSLTFNIGPGGFARSSVARFFNLGEYKRAANAFLLWNKATNRKTGVLEVSNGLVRRRNAEKFLFLDDPSWRDYL